MKYVRVLATAALLSAASVGAPVAAEPWVPVQAQLKTPMGPDGKAYCAPSEDLLRDLAEYYGEFPLVIGRTHDGYGIIITLNPITGSWTSILLTSDECCVFDFGANMSGMSLLCERGALPLVCIPKI
jgi:hypothetical protein